MGSPSAGPPDAVASVAPPALTATATDGGRASALVSPELFELVGRWTAASDLAQPGFGGPPDLIGYARANAPALVEEAAQIIGGVPKPPSLASSNAIACGCSMLGTFSTYQEITTTGPTWSVSSKGLAHHAHIAQAATGVAHEDVANLSKQSAQLLTRLLCVTPQGAACAGTCTAQLSADVEYSANAVVSSHGSESGFTSTAQLSDGATFDLRQPSGSPTLRFFEKAMSLHQSAGAVAFASASQASTLRSGLGIGSALETNTPGLSGSLSNSSVKSMFGVLESLTPADGNSTQQLIAAYQTLFDAPEPIAISLRTSPPAIYTIQLASQLNMKVGGSGSHGESGDLASSYALAVLFDGFTCDASVSQPPQPTGFWRYDGYDGAPLNVATLQFAIGDFFAFVAGVTVPVNSQNPGSYTQASCGNSSCDLGETPASCPQDCHPCGDGTCTPPFETLSNCPADCHVCGDVTCTAPFESSGNCLVDCPVCGDQTCTTPIETSSNCLTDCPVCGDRICTRPLETSSNCLTDCAVCGDRVCSAPLENSDTCLVDCPVCGDHACTPPLESSGNCLVDCPICGDQKCTPPLESSGNCLVDCPICGDQKCTAPLEHSGNCLVDCPVCGDHVCTPPLEHSGTCLADCPVCDDHICSAPLENLSNCPSDCHTCGDSVCTPPFETFRTCEFDCPAPCSARFSCQDGQDVSCRGEGACFTQSPGPQAPCGGVTCDGQVFACSVPPDGGFCFEVPLQGPARVAPPRPTAGSRPTLGPSPPAPTASKPHDPGISSIVPSPIFFPRRTR